MGTFRAAYGWWGAKRPPLPKICHTHPTMIKLGTVIPCLKKIQKIYESRDTPSEFCISALFHRKSANFVISRNTDIECILLHNFLNRVKLQKSIFKFNINMVDGANKKTYTLVNKDAHAKMQNPYQNCFD